MCIPCHKIYTLLIFSRIGKNRLGGLHSNVFNTIISTENLLEAWKEFIKGKRNRKDVQEFQMSLMQNIISLYADLNLKTYKHGSYQSFNISDPKPRNIHKASVRDRLLHHAIHRLISVF